jgi:hypothetical protein
MVSFGFTITCSAWNGPVIPEVHGNTGTALALWLDRPFTRQRRTGEIVKQPVMGR